MKKYLSIAICILLFATLGKAKAQISCDALISYVESNCSRSYSQVPATLLWSSKFIKNIIGYNCEDNIVVIAELYVDKYKNSKKYIFCNIPSRNWSWYTWPLGCEGDGPRFGYTRNSKDVQFRKYIFDYQCDCN